MEILTWLATYPVHLTLAAVFGLLIAVRTLVWRRRPHVHCETCAHAGPARRVIRGYWWVEALVLVHGLTIGLVAIELLSGTLVFFLWRSLGSYLTCAACGSERIAKSPAGFAGLEAPGRDRFGEFAHKWFEERSGPVAIRDPID